MIKFRFILLLLSIPLFSFSGNDTIFYDSIPFIKRHEKKVSIRPYIKQKFVFLNISGNYTDTIDSPDIHYAPSAKTAIGISGGYKGYIIGLAFALPYDQKTLEKYGRTDYSDLRASLYSRKFGGDAFLQKYKGFYLSNPASFDSSWADSLPFPRNRNLELKTFGFNLFYIFKKKFSFISAFGHTEQQIKNAGSLLFMLSLRNSKLNTWKSLVPLNSQMNYLKLDSLRQGNYTTISFIPGYGQTFTRRDLFLSMAGYLGIGGQMQKYQLIDKWEKNLVPVFKFNLRFAMGYNGDRRYAGLSFNADSNTIPMDNADMSVILFSWKLAFGLRL